MSASVDFKSDVEAILPPIYASVKAEVNGSVVRTVNADVGNQFSVTVPPGATAYGI
jgi:hypothetical protein